MSDALGLLGMDDSANEKLVTLGGVFRQAGSETWQHGDGNELKDSMAINPATASYCTRQPEEDTRRHAPQPLLLLLAIGSSSGHSGDHRAPVTGGASTCRNLRPLQLHLMKVESERVLKR
eukprot:CAMPEP_0115883650 /NCGR_PEP_ID=MMETSP0287-20121206/29680_1 /TAXON_ID=412157 /ORGANISM="Chrysochromulina rotalis, Strain UIO044" /LENGTH=119 /DNA_ID=CAMNT_0003339867 /DNA_START=25 /DNA_END=382 /DNA_ORIENTATION=+